MNVICISGSALLIKGKSYELLGTDGDMYEIGNPDSSYKNYKNWNTSWSHKINFETIVDIRERRLKEIGII